MEHRILLTSASAPLGATLLDHILASNEPALIYQTINVLVRSGNEARKLERAYHERVNAIILPNSSHGGVLAEVAKECDIIIDTAEEGDAAEQAKCLIDGLAKQARSRSGAGAPWYVMIVSGSSAASATKEARKEIGEEGLGNRENQSLSGKLAVQPMGQASAVSRSKTAALDIVSYSECHNIQTLVLNTGCVIGFDSSSTGTDPQHVSELQRTLRHIIHQAGSGTLELDSDASLDWVSFNFIQTGTQLTSYPRYTSSTSATSSSISSPVRSIHPTGVSNISFPRATELSTWPLDACH